jgi:hypothetical protein
VQEKPVEEHRESVTGARVLTGELLAASDLDGIAPADSVKPVLQAILRDVKPARVLLAGPRSVALIPVVPEEIRLEVLLRSVPDIRVASDEAGLHASARLWVGGLDAFTTDAPFDVVVALGGPGVLLGPDSRGMSHSEVVSALAALVAPGGTLVTDVANGLGLADLTAAERRDAADHDGDWFVGAAGFDRRSPYLPELAADLDAAGLTATTTYAAFPTLQHHSLLVDVDRAASGDLPGTLARSLATLTVRRHFDHAPSLRDAGDAAEQVFDAGLLAQLAPAWLVVARAGDPTDRTTSVPAIVATESGPNPLFSRSTVVDTDGTPVTTWATGTADAEVTEGGLARNLESPAVLSGRLLDLELFEACALRDHARIRRLLVRYRAFLEDEKRWSGKGSGRRFFAVPANLILDDEGGLSVFDDSWSFETRLTAQDHFVHGARHFAERLLASGRPHPWRVGTTPDTLTITLGSMAGLTVTPARVAGLAPVTASVDAIVLGRPGDEETLAEDYVERGAFARDLPAANAAGYRELLGHERRMARRHREHEGQVAWLEGTLRLRDRYIRELERMIEGYEETLTYRTVQAIRAPRRIATEKAVDTAKATVKDALPPDFLNRARSFARRAMASQQQQAKD